MISAFILAGKRVYEKRLSDTFGNFAMGFIVHGFSLLPMFILIFLLPGGTDIGSLSWTFWWPLFIIWFILYPVQTYLLYRSMREGDVSAVVPVMALLPVFTVGASFVLLGEVPSMFGWTGIILIVLGTYFMLWNKASPQKISIPVLLMIGSMFCMAIGTSLDKISMQVSNPVFYSFVNTLGATIIFLILMRFYKEKGSFVNMRREFWLLTLLGIFQAIGYISFIYAIGNGPVSYVLALRSGSFLLVALYGILFLRENMTNRKLVALTLFLAGAVALAFA